MRSLYLVVFATLGGCVIGGLDLTDKDCPCETGYQCDPATNHCVSDQLDLSVAETPTNPDGDVADGLSPNATVGGENLYLAPGFTAMVYKDFSHDMGYTYCGGPDLGCSGYFTDPSFVEPDDNRPRGIITLVSPFKEGLAILCGRQILFLYSDGTFELKDYSPSMPDISTALNIPTDIAFAPKTSVADARILVSGVSLGVVGDGVFQIDTTLAEKLLYASNNDGCVLSDPTGTFGAQSGPRTYVCSYTNGGGNLYRLVDGSSATPTSIYSSISSIDDAEVLASGNMALVVESKNGDVSLAELVYAGGMPRYGDVPGIDVESSIRLVTGDLTRLPPGIHAIPASNRLVEVADGDVEQVTLLAQTLTPGWTWAAAAVPPSGHSLDPTGKPPAYVLLESNRALNIDRVLLLTSP